MDIQKDFIQRLRGRAEFCRNRGEVKTPELLEHAAQLLEEKAQMVPEGFVLVPREPTDAMRNLFNESLVVIYRAMIEVAEKEMIAAQEQN